MIRKTFFIKPRLQVKYLLISLLLTLISSGLIYLTLNEILFSTEKLADVPDIAILQVQEQFQHGFIWVAVLLMIAFGIESMFRFHRLVGPIYVVEKMVNTFATGDLTQDFHLRKHDELQDLVSELLSMRDRIRSNLKSDREKCQSISEKLTQLANSIERNASPETLKKEIGELQRELASVTSQFKI